MFKFLRKKKAQSTLEYAVLIIIVIGALLSIQVYIKRGVQGRLKSASDDIGDQFSHGNMNVTRKTIVTSSTRESFSLGKTNSYLLNAESTTVTGNEQIRNFQQEYWGR